MIDYDTPGWRVSLPVFEGPLDLLLFLIKRDEVDIYDIEIGRITDQYLAYLEAMQEMDLEVAGEFLVVAATLIYLKSRSLLPVDQQMPEEEEDQEDPRWELIRQLVEYKKFKDAAYTLELKGADQGKVFRRDSDPSFKKPVAPGVGNVDVMDLIAAFQKILDRIKEQERFREVVEDRFTVGDRIQMIKDRIFREKKIQFLSLFNELTSRAEIVVTFLAVLELIRLKKLRAVQTNPFEDIEIVGV